MNESKPVFDELQAWQMQIDPAWGREATDQLLNQTYNGETKDDKKEHYWGLLSMYTRDLRLGNLDKFMFPVMVDYTSLANDLLVDGYGRSFMACMSKVIPTMEISQSRNGFLRKRSRTSTKEEKLTMTDNNKRGLFGGNKQREEEYRR